MKKTVLIALLPVLALAQMVAAQTQREHTKFQAEFSLTWNSALNMYGINILNTDSEEAVSQTERPAFYLAASQLSDFNRWFALKYGLSLSDRGYKEDITIIYPNSLESFSRNIRMYYLGLPLTLAFNLKNNKRLISGFAEAGLSPEFLLHHTKSDYLNYNLNRVALNGMVNAGMKINFHDQYSVVISPGVQFALFRFDDNKQENPFQIRDFRPFSANITLGFQF